MMKSSFLILLASLTLGISACSNEETDNLKPKRLIFSQQPIDTKVNTAIAPSITVSAVDRNGNVVPTFNGQVALTIHEGPDRSKLLGTAVQPAVNGIATFHDLALSEEGVHTLSAVAGSLDEGKSSSFQVIPIKNSVLAVEDDTVVEKRFAGEFETFSTQGATYNRAVAEKKMLPRGSAYVTRSGKLKALGITQIIHTAPGSIGIIDEDFTPTLESIQLSLKNALRLARANGHTCVAIPFIASGVFLSRIAESREKLVSTIVSAVLGSKKELDIHFVILPARAAALFSKEVARLTKKEGRSSSNVHVLVGDVLDFSEHRCSAIINSGNMEGEFGGMISAAIGHATGDAQGINKEMKAEIKRFNRRLLEMHFEH